MSPEENGWKEWKQHILHELKRQGETLKEQGELLNAHMASEAEWQRQVSEQLGVLSAVIKQPREIVMKQSETSKAEHGETAFRVNLMWAIGGGLLMIIATEGLKAGVIYLGGR